MRVYVVPAKLRHAKKAIVQLGDDVLVAYDPSNGGSLERARDVAAIIDSHWSKQLAAAVAGGDDQGLALDC